MAGGTKPDFNDAPFIAIWEVTQACDLACQHCRASAHPERSLLELTTAEGEALLQQVHELAVPVFVLTGGDPMKRPDIFHLVVRHPARRARLDVAQHYAAIDAGRGERAQSLRLGAARRQHRWRHRSRA